MAHCNAEIPHDVVFPDDKLEAPSKQHPYIVSHLPMGAVDAHFSVTETKARAQAAHTTAADVSFVPTEAWVWLNA
jgi:hypothetical protein